MKYRTIIEVITEADNSHDAMDITGEFLRGNLEDGVKMRCFSRPIRFHTFFRAGIFFVSIVLLTGIVLGKNLSHNAVSPGPLKGISAVQPPLKTHEGTDFKETWQDEENKKVLEYIKD